MRKPDLFILGAPKCGTTALATWLSEHPYIYMSPVKEPHFFNTDGLRATRSREEYLKLFQDADNGHRVLGEASTHYLYSKEAVPNILEFNPEAQFIVCLRNPVQMASSLHSERIYQGRETETEFGRAWRLQGARRAGRKIPVTLRDDPERLQYGAYCRLGEQMERLYRLVSRDRVLPLLLDDFRVDERGVYLQVLRFLDLEYDGRTEFGTQNARKRVRSPRLARCLKRVATLKNSIGIQFSVGIANWLDRANTQEARSTEIKPEIESELKAYFKEDVELLSSLLDRKLNHWIE